MIKLFYIALPFFLIWLYFTTFHLPRKIKKSKTNADKFLARTDHIKFSRCNISLKSKMGNQDKIGDIFIFENSLLFFGITRPGSNTYNTCFQLYLPDKDYHQIFDDSDCFKIKSVKIDEDDLIISYIRESRTLEIKNIVTPENLHQIKRYLQV